MYLVFAVLAVTTERAQQFLNARFEELVQLSVLFAVERVCQLIPEAESQIDNLNTKKRATLCGKAALRKKASAVVALPKS